MILDCLQSHLKTYPGLYNLLTLICSPVMQVGKGSKALFEKMPSNAKILNLGAGTKRYLGALNVDIFPFPTTDIVADAAALPFSSDSVDGVICEVMLEHAIDPEAIIIEIYRVLKKGGYLYLAVPFMLGYHSSPSDYQRWTLPGIAHVLEGFEIIESGIRGGPTSALLWIFQEWLAMALSFNITPLYSAIRIGLMLLTFPVKLLDLLFSHYSMANRIAATVYCLGVKG